MNLGERPYWEVKILVRQISTGLYWKSGTGWVQAQDAEVFPGSASALFYCITNEMRDVHVVLSFDDPRYDVVLHPFGERGGERTSQELAEETRAKTAQSKELAAKSKALLAGVHETVAAIKERKKQRPFKRKRLAGEEDPG